MAEQHNPASACSFQSCAKVAPDTYDSIIQGIMCSAANVNEKAKWVGDVKMLSMLLARGKLQSELFSQEGIQKPNPAKER